MLDDHAVATDGHTPLPSGVPTKTSSFDKKY